MSPGYVVLTLETLVVFAVIWGLLDQGTQGPAKERCTADWEAWMQSGGKVEVCPAALSMVCRAMGGQRPRFGWATRTQGTRWTRTAQHLHRLAQQLREFALNSNANFCSVYISSPRPPRPGDREPPGPVLHSHIICGGEHPPNFTVLRKALCGACRRPHWRWEGRRGAEAALVSGGATVPLSPRKTTFPPTGCPPLAVFLDLPSSPPTQRVGNQPPIHKWRVTPSKGAQVRTPGRTSPAPLRIWPDHMAALAQGPSWRSQHRVGLHEVGHDSSRFFFGGGCHQG